MLDVNLIGTWTLYCKEVRRFIKVYNQTLLAPVISALLFLAVFKLAVGNHITIVATVPFEHFMAAGLIMMAVMQNAFANTSSSFTMGKVLGTIIDYLMPPISAGELTFAMTMAGVTRGICVGVLVASAIVIFASLSLVHPGYALFYLISAALLLSLLGMFAGIIAETFDHAAAVTSYVITPLTFLSGTFYSVHNLPALWYHISQYNPFFYMIDGFRYALTGYHESSISVGIIVITTINIFMWIVVHTMIAKGYRIKD